MRTTPRAVTGEPHRLPPWSNGAAETKQRPPRNGTVPVLPAEIWTLIVGYVPREHLAIVAATSRSFRAIAHRIGIRRIPLSLVTQSVSLIEWAHAVGCAWDARTCAAGGGHLAVLEWLRGYNPDGMPSDRERWDARTCAAGGGHLAVLEWARGYNPDGKWSDREPWDESTVLEAAEKGHLAVLKWARNHGADIIQACSVYAARGGHLDVLKWLLGMGSPPHINTMAIAAYYGHLDVLKWLCDVGLQPNGDTCAIAAGEGRLEVVKWLSTVVTWNTLTCQIAAYNGHYDVLRWAHEHGCPWNALLEAITRGHLDIVMYICGYDGVTDAIPWTTECSATAAEYNRLDILKWARTHGFPWDADTCAQAARNGHIDLLEWAHTQGCPWNDQAMTFAGCNLPIIMYLRGYNRDGETRWTDNDADCLPWSDRTCYVAARKGNFSALKWAVYHGCPWDPDACFRVAKRADIQDWIHTNALV